MIDNSAPHCEMHDVYQGSNDRQEIKLFIC